MSFAIHFCFSASTRFFAQKFSRRLAGLRCLWMMFEAQLFKSNQILLNTRILYWKINYVMPKNKADFG